MSGSWRQKRINTVDQSTGYTELKVSIGCHGVETLADQSEIQDGSHGRYNIEYKGKEISEDRVLLLSYGKGKRLFRIADVSNGDIEEVSSALLSEGATS